MKYVRTEDGIYILDSQFRKPMNEHIKDYAYTIQELCDLFVVKITLIEENYALYRYKELSEANLAASQIGAPLYGAIWTEKGLIYVAKLNKKGEFELL